jgi:hypothetical protein
MAAQELEKLRRETREREVWRRRRPERRHEWMEHGLALCDFRSIRATRRMKILGIEDRMTI